MRASPYSYMTTPDQAKIRTGFWPAQNESKSETRNIVLLTGRASFMERFDEVIQKLTSQDFNVWSFDWRGQGLSSRPLENHQKGHIDSYDTYLKDLDQFMTQVVQPRTQNLYMILAQSMGAHIALRYLENNPQNIFSGAMLISPMLDIRTGWYPRFFVRFLSSFCTKFGFQENFVLGHGKYDPALEPFEGNYYTQDPIRYKTYIETQNHYAALMVGGPTYGWLDATLRSVQSLISPTKIQNIEIPIWLIESGNDQVVDNRLIAYVLKFLKFGFHRKYHQARHQIFLETDDILTQFWQDFKVFAEQIYIFKNRNLYKDHFDKVPVLIRQQVPKSNLPSSRC